MNFPYRLEARPAPSRAMQLAVPLVAAVLTLMIGFLIFTLVGQDPVRAMHGFFHRTIVERERLVGARVEGVTAVPDRAGTGGGVPGERVNIGAEGQMLLGGIVAGGIAIHVGDATGWWILPLMMIGGVIGGMAWGRDSRVAQEPFQHQRNSDEPDAHLRRDAVADLSGQRSVA